MSILRLCLIHLCTPPTSHSAWYTKSAPQRWLPKQAHAVQEVYGIASGCFLQLPIWHMTLAWAHPKTSIFNYLLLAHDFNETKIWYHRPVGLWLRLTTTVNLYLPGQVQGKLYGPRQDRTSRWWGCGRHRRPPLPSNGIGICNNHNNC